MRNVWKLCPDSCRRVLTSSSFFAAFMKMKGSFASASPSWYPPGAFPFLLSRSRSPSSDILWKYPESCGSTSEMTLWAPDVRPVASSKGDRAGLPSGSASLSQGLRTSTPIFFWTSLSISRFRGTIVSSTALWNASQSLGV